MLRDLRTVSNDIYPESSDERSKRPGCPAIHSNLFNFQGHFGFSALVADYVTTGGARARCGASDISGRSLAKVWRHEQGDEFGQKCDIASGYRRPGLRCE